VAQDRASGGVCASLSLVGQPMPIHITCGKFNSRSLVAGFHARQRFECI
jgi:hypothetical protein